MSSARCAPRLASSSVLFVGAQRGSGKYLGSAETPQAVLLVLRASTETVSSARSAASKADRSGPAIGLSGPGALCRLVISPGTGRDTKELIIKMLPSPNRHATCTAHIALP